MENFFFQYQSPHWQKKRLLILQRDNFQCQSCGGTEKTLNVHHSVPYEKNKKVWDYENDELVTLCQDCHKEISNSIEYCKLIIFGFCSNSVTWATELQSLLENIDGLNPAELQSLTEYIKTYKKNGTF